MKFMLATSLAGATLAVPHTLAAPRRPGGPRPVGPKPAVVGVLTSAVPKPVAAPIWAEAQNDAAYHRCAAILPDNPCVREVFYLQGSFGELRRSCGPAGLLSGQDTIPLELDVFYPSSLFPSGPQCGRIHSYASEYSVGRYVNLSPEEYGPICEMCTGYDSQTIVIDDDVAETAETAKTADLSECHVI